MKTCKSVLYGKPDVGNPHVRFDEGEVAPAKPRRGSLPYKLVLAVACATLSGAACAVGQNISVTDAQNVSVLDAETQVDVASGGTAELRAVPCDVTVRAQKGGKVRLGIYSDDTVTNAPWASKVGLWLDASHVETLLAETNNVGVVSTVTDGGKTYVAINRWLDRRPDHTMWRGYNNRGTLESDGTYKSVMPFVVSNGCNDLTYVSLGTCAAWGRRLPFIKVVNGVEQAGSAGSKPSNAIAATYVMMVIGTQNGGGQAVLSNLPRANTTLSVTASVGIFASDRETRLDGADVADPTTTGFNGGWQTLAFSASGATVDGLGYATFGQVYGGQNYAEVLVFTNAPTTAEIRSAEAYLAEKWGIKTYVKDNAGGSVRLYGAGAAEVVVGEAKLGGSFQGTMTVAAGATLKLTDTSSVPTNAAALTVGAQTALQFDTDRKDLTIANTGIYKCTNYASLNTLSNILDATYMPLRGVGRGPAFVKNSTFNSWGWGPERTWYAYATNWTMGRINGSNSGNTSRFGKENESSGYTYDTRTLFMVLDTSAGGGTPFLDTSVSVWGTSCSQYVTYRTANSPIFRATAGEACAFVTNSPCYLNGVAVKSGERAFNGRAELLSCTFSQAMPIKCLGYYGDNADTTDLRHGEVILCQEALSDKERQDTEAYLMNKWLGIAPSGYGDLSGMTVDGAGTVVATNGVNRPQFAATFTGAYDLTAADTLSFTAADGVIADAIAVPDGTVTLPASVTVTVTATGSLPKGETVLVSAKTLNGGTTLTLAPDRIRNRYKLLKQDNKLVLSRRYSGVILSVR